MAKGPMTVTGFIAFAQGWGGLYIRANKLAYDQLKRHPGLGIPNRRGIPDVPERVHWEDDMATDVGTPGRLRLRARALLVADVAPDELDGRRRLPRRATAARSATTTSSATGCASTGASSTARRTPTGARSSSSSRRPATSTATCRPPARERSACRPRADHQLPASAPPLFDAHRTARATSSTRTSDASPSSPTRPSTNCGDSSACRSSTPSSRGATRRRANIRHYAHGIGDANPLWTDPDYRPGRHTARSSPHQLRVRARSVLSGYVGGCPASTPCGRRRSHVACADRSRYEDRDVGPPRRPRRARDPLRRPARSSRSTTSTSRRRTGPRCARESWAPHRAHTARGHEVHGGEAARASRLHLGAAAGDLRVTTDRCVAPTPGMPKTSRWARSCRRWPRDR